MSFNCNVSDGPGVKTFTLSGRLIDQAEANELMATVESEVQAGNNRILMDLSELRYMNSTGLRVMINALTKARNAGGEAVIANVSEAVKQLFLVTKLDTIFTIAATKEEALERLAG